MKKTTEDQLYVMGWSILAMVVFLMVLLKILHLSLADILPGCILYRVTGWYCPGCGGTRALGGYAGGVTMRNSQTVEKLTHSRIRIGMKYHDRYLGILLAILVLHCVIRNVLKLLWGIEIPL